jgi:hypothetical protein
MHPISNNSIREKLDLLHKITVISIEMSKQIESQICMKCIF